MKIILLYVRPFQQEANAHFFIVVSFLLYRNQIETKICIRGLD